MTQDRYHLDRFVQAQGGVYDDVLAELRAGRKRRHWMWFVFPQIANNLKLRSSMTLFARAATEPGVFGDVLDRYFDGEPDPRTLDQLG